MDASLTILLRPINKFFSKYHSTIFFTLITLLLAAAILALYLATQAPSDQTSNTPPTTISATFDTATADKVKQLRQSDESSPGLAFPQPRSNPFVE